MILRKTSKQLLEKSSEAFLMALEIYNKPTINYRLEAFAFFYINAWELMIKAYLIEKEKNTKAIYRSDGKTHSLDFCLNKIFTTATEFPIKKNILDIEDLRDQATHLVIPELESVYAGLFQRGVIHFLDHRKKWFGLGINISSRMMTLVFDFDPRDITLVKLKSLYGKQVVDFFQKKQKRVIGNIKKLGKDYSIEIGYKLALIKNPNKADFLVASSSDSKTKSVFITVPKDAALTHNYLTTKLCDEISTKLGTKFGQYQLNAIKNYDGIDEITHPEFVYKNRVYKNASPQYSPEFRDYLIKKAKDKDYMVRCIAKYRTKPKISRKY